MLPAHSAVVWATNCTGKKTLCNRSAIVYSGKVTTATGFRALAEWEGREWLMIGFRRVFVQMCLLRGYPVFFFSYKAKPIRVYNQYHTLYS